MIVINVARPCALLLQSGPSFFVREYEMSYLHLVYVHLATILPAFVIGTYLMIRRKGTQQHRLLGKVFLILLIATAITTLFLKAEVGPTLFGHFGFIHLFSFLTLYSAPAAFFAARRGNIKVHRFYMIGLYLGALLIAGAFTLVPGRMIHTWLFVRA